MSALASVAVQTCLTATGHPRTYIVERPYHRARTRFHITSAAGPPTKPVCVTFSAGARSACRGRSQCPEPGHCRKDATAQYKLKGDAPTNCSDCRGIAVRSRNCWRVSVAIKRGESQHASEQNQLNQQKAAVVGREQVGYMIKANEEPAVYQSAEHEQRHKGHSDGREPPQRAFQIDNLRSLGRRPQQEHESDQRADPGCCSQDAKDVGKKLHPAVACRAVAHPPEVTTAAVPVAVAKPHSLGPGRFITRRSAALVVSPARHNAALPMPMFSMASTGSLVSAASHVPVSSAVCAIMLSSAARDSTTAATMSSGCSHRGLSLSRDGSKSKRTTYNDMRWQEP